MYQIIVNGTMIHLTITIQFCLEKGGLVQPGQGVNIFVSFSRGQNEERQKFSLETVARAL